MAEKYRRLSPYVYGNNNPMRFIDPDGMGAAEWIENINKFQGGPGNPVALQRAYSEVKHFIFIVGMKKAKWIIKNKK